MARSLKNKPNVKTPDGKFPYARIKDDTGIDDGTPVDEQVYGDIHQFFVALMEDAMAKSLDGFQWNELPENAYDGFQFLTALKRFKPYKYYVANMNQSGTAAPVPTIFENNIGSIVWTRSSPGEYAGTLTGKFPAGKTWAISCNGAGGTGGLEGVNILRTSDNTVVLRSYDDVTNAPSDDILLDTAIEIRVYP